MATLTAPTPSGTTVPPASPEGTPRRASIRAFIQRRPAPAFYALAFASSWAGILLGVGALALLRAAEDRAVARIWGGLETTPSTGQVFSPDLVAGLPDPARRYFLHAIRPGAPLAARVRLTQTGSIRFGGGWARFAAEQLLTRGGFVWKAASRVGPLPITATDHYAGGRGRMRAAAFGLVPFVSATGPELTRSAIGRLVVEHMWLPSAWLPQAGATIEPVDDDRFAVVLAVGGETPRLVLRVDAEGRLLESSLPRFGNQAPDGRFRYIPFGGLMDAEEAFGGYTIPTRIRAGWWYGTDRYQEDFRFQITAATYA
jgi:hypothetical protein